LVNPAYLTEKLCSPTPRRGPLQRLLYAKEAKELLSPSILFRPERRADVLDRYRLAKRMIGYLQGSPPGELTRRFDQLQRYIFEVTVPPDQRRLDHFQHWLLDDKPLQGLVTQHRT
jgi:hypothetical protein